jgi:hypothetical protein
MLYLGSEKIQGQSAFTEVKLAELSNGNNCTKTSLVILSSSEEAFINAIGGPWR